MERKQEQDTTDDRQKQGNPADETVIYKIGGTFYEAVSYTHLTLPTIA